MKATFLLEVEHVDQLNDIRETLESIPGVFEVRRVLGPGVGPEKIQKSDANGVSPASMDANGMLADLVGGSAKKKKARRKPA